MLMPPFPDVVNRKSFLDAQRWISKHFTKSKITKKPRQTSLATDQHKTVKPPACSLCFITIGLRRRETVSWYLRKKRRAQRIAQAKAGSRQPGMLLSHWLTSVQLLFDWWFIMLVPLKLTRESMLTFLFALLSIWFLIICFCCLLKVVLECNSCQVDVEFDGLKTRACSYFGFIEMLLPITFWSVSQFI